MGQFPGVPGAAAGVSLLPAAGLVGGNDAPLVQPSSGSLACAAWGAYIRHKLLLG